MGFFDRFKRKPVQDEVSSPIATIRMLLLFNSPTLCVACTSLAQSEFMTETERAGGLTTKWLLDNRNILIGTIMGLNEPHEIRELVAKWDEAGFSTQVLCNVAPADLQSKALEEPARAYLTMRGLAQDDYHAVPMAMADVYEKTPFLVYYWFFKNALAQ